MPWGQIREGHYIIVEVGGGEVGDNVRTGNFSRIHWKLCNWRGAWGWKRWGLLGNEVEPDNSGFAVCSRRAWRSLLLAGEEECRGARTGVHSQWGGYVYKEAVYIRKQKSVCLFTCKIIFGFVSAPCQAWVPQVMGKKLDSHASISTFFWTSLLCVRWATSPWHNSSTFVGIQDPCSSQPPLLWSSRVPRLLLATLSCRSRLVLSLSHFSSPLILFGSRDIVGVIPVPSNPLKYT